MSVRDYLEWWYSLNYFHKIQEYLFLKKIVLTKRLTSKCKQVAKWIKEKGEKLAMMWKCRKCNTKFSDEEAYFETDENGISTMECPKCHHDILLLLSKCVACKEHEVTSRVAGLCKSCWEEVQARYAIFKKDIQQGFNITEERWEELWEALKCRDNK